MTTMMMMTMVFM